MAAYATFDVAAGFGFGRIHKVEPEDPFLAVSLNVEAVAVVALVFDKAAASDGFPFAGESRSAEPQKQGVNGGGFHGGTAAPYPPVAISGKPIPWSCVWGAGGAAFSQ